MFFILPSKRKVCVLLNTIESIKYSHVKEKYAIHKNIKK